MHKNGRYHHGHRTKGIGENMEEDAMHVLVSVRMSMTVVMSMMCVSVFKRHDTD